MRVKDFDVNRSQRGTVWISDKWQRDVVLARHVTWRRKIGWGRAAVTVFCLSLIFLLHYVMNASVVFSASFHGIVLFWTWLISPGATGYKRQYKKRGISNKRSALSVSDKGKLGKRKSVFSQMESNLRRSTTFVYLISDTSRQRIKEEYQRRIVNHHENIWYVRYINILPLPFAGVFFSFAIWRHWCFRDGKRKLSQLF